MTAIDTPNDLRNAIERPDWSTEAPRSLHGAGQIALDLASALDAVDVELVRALARDHEFASALQHDLARARSLGRDLARASDRELALNRARDLARSLHQALSFDLDVAVAVDARPSQDLARAQNLALGVARDGEGTRRLADTIAGLAPGADGPPVPVLHLFDWVGSIIHGLTVYGESAREAEGDVGKTGDVGTADGGAAPARRRDNLSQDEAISFLAGFEAAFSAITNAGQDRLISEDVEQDVLNLMRQFELARQRPNVPTLQLELLIGELLELLNGDIEDALRFRRSFEQLGADAALAQDLAERLAAAIRSARDALTGDSLDPDEIADAMHQSADVDAVIRRLEETPIAELPASDDPGWVERRLEDAGKGGAALAGAGIVRELWRTVEGDDTAFTKIARQLVAGFTRLWLRLYGGE